MEKYKFRSTVYLVFLLVSLFVNGLLLYMLISNYPANKKCEIVDDEINIDEVMSEINKVYKDAYDFINGDNFLFPKEYQDGNNGTRVCYLVDSEKLKKYFISDFLDDLDSNLIDEHGEKYDCNDVVQRIMLSGLFDASNDKIIKLNYVFSDSDIFLVSGSVSRDTRPLYMVLKIVDGSIMIDSFE